MQISLGAILLLSTLRPGLTSAQSRNYIFPSLPLPTVLQKFKGPRNLPRGPYGSQFPAQPQFPIPTFPIQSVNQHLSGAPTSRSKPSLKVFIAAALKDGQDHLNGAWSSAVIELILQLGPSNVYLSVFEEHSNPVSLTNAVDFRNRVPCSSSVISQPLSNLPGDTYPKRRVSQIANARNKAFQPFYDLWNNITQFPIEPQLAKPFDRILWLNDVFFNPADIVSLLYDTNDGNYSAACAMDFWDPVRMYDYFALRDTEGQPLKRTTYPFFNPSKSYDQLRSRRRDVPVSACWGGAVAFEATAFYKNKVQFRDSGSSFWEASECCLIHADIDQPERTFLNTNVRVAYDEWTFSWLPVAALLEKFLAPLIHWYQDSTCFACSRTRFDQSKSGKPTLVLHDTELLYTGKDGYCGWGFMMYLGTYENSNNVSVPGRFVLEHQDYFNSTYWISTLDHLKSVSVTGTG